MKGIGKRIKSLRALHGMKQEDLASKLGVSISTVSSWEKDVNEPSLKIIEVLCDLFHVTPNTLIGLGKQDLVFNDEKDRLMLTIYRDIMPEKLREIMRSISSYAYDQYAQQQKKDSFEGTLKVFISQYGLARLWEDFNKNLEMGETMNIQSFYRRSRMKEFIEELLKEKFPEEENEITDREYNEICRDLDQIEKELE